ncbi:proton channel OtopLc-like [Phymastichus coffea]|uniref:proton channel OtopLc-like n=1 Tax=Phymastichus coffea TaxID=108790 RepID=UPI00273CA823|nr:proton channel OtopLc-like [Phymastichus coffea]
MLNGAVTTYSDSSSNIMQQQQQPIDVEAVAAEIIPSRTRSHSLRRQSISLNAVINHRRALFGALLQGMGSNMSLTSCVPPDQDHQQQQMNDETSLAQHKLQLAPVNSNTPLDHSREDKPEERRRRQQAELMSSLSTLYAKLLVVVGVAVPVTASVSQQVPAALDRGFYLYLYLASVAFVVTMYTTLLRDKALKTMIAKHVAQETTTYTFDSAPQQQKQQQQPPTICKCSKITRKHHSHTQQYGSFCLRLGTVGFGAGSLVFTGLQIGAELANGPILRAVIPATRLLLVTAQMHFIFLNSKDMVLTRHEALAKLGLMHMIATNVCEWLQALVEETRYEIVQLEHARDEEVSSGAGMLRKLLRDASPFLFPCTIEFSLICAVILFEMWKRVDERSTNSLATTCSRSVHQLSIDCASAHRGLFGGILVVAATVLSLIMFFVLKEAKPQMAIEQVTSLEVAIQSSGVIAAVIGGLKIRALDFRNAKPPHLDSTLLAAAQAGVYLHCLFGAVGSILTQGPSWMICLAADLMAMLQSTTQTLLIKIAWRRRSRTDEKPGKELITFLIVVNIAMWTVNTLEKSRAGVRPDHLEFFGVWAWTIITHVSMPLAIFYRFHSAICLFEVWKSCYKYRPPVAAY